MPKDATATRERILDAAQEIVLRRGFAATSVDRVQEAAEISRGTFFYHFASKDELARALLARYAAADRALTEQLKARAERLANDPLQQLLVFMALHEELFETMGDADPGCLFASYTYEAGLFDDETHDLIRDSIAHWREIVGGWLERAMAAEEPVAPLDPATWADMAYATIQGAFILSRVEGDASVMVTQIRQLRTFLELLFGRVTATAIRGGSDGA